MNYKREAYGVFLLVDKKATLIFGDDGSYAVYERYETAKAFKIEMDIRWRNVAYEVKEVTIEAKTDD